MGKKSKSGSGMSIPNHISESLETYKFVIYENIGKIGEVYMRYERRKQVMRNQGEKRAQGLGEQKLQDPEYSEAPYHSW